MSIRESDRGELGRGKNEEKAESGNGHIKKNGTVIIRGLNAEGHDKENIIPLRFQSYRLVKYVTGETYVGGAKNDENPGEIEKL